MAQDGRRDEVDHAADERPRGPSAAARAGLGIAAPADGNSEPIVVGFVAPVDRPAAIGQRRKRRQSGPGA